MCGLLRFWFIDPSHNQTNVRQKILSAFGSWLLHIVSHLNITVVPRRRLMTFCTRKLQPSLTCCPCHSNCSIWRLSFQCRDPPGSALHLSGESSLLPLSSGISGSAKVRHISGWSGRPRSGWALREREPPHVFWQMVLNHVRKIKKMLKSCWKKKPDISAPGDMVLEKTENYSECEMIDINDIFGYF